MKSYVLIYPDGRRVELPKETRLLEEGKRSIFRVPLSEEEGHDFSTIRAEIDHWDVTGRRLFFKTENGSSIEEIPSPPMSKRAKVIIGAILIGVAASAYYIGSHSHADEKREVPMHKTSSLLDLSLYSQVEFNRPAYVHRPPAKSPHTLTRPHSPPHQRPPNRPAPRGVTRT